MYYIKLNPSKLTLHEWQEMEQQLSTMKHRASQSQEVKCVGGFVGLCLNFKFLYKGNTHLQKCTTK